jgi:hypothetical protein
MKTKASMVLASASALLGLALASATATTVTFESLLTTPNTFRNGSDVSGKFTSEGVDFPNRYTAYPGGSYWSGFAISNTTDTLTPGYANESSAYAGSGAGGSSAYAVAYGNVSLNFATSINLSGLGASVTNTTYAALGIIDGVGPARAFALGDWFKLTVTGYLNMVPTSSVDFYLADYRAGALLVNDWQYVDFSPLGTVDEIGFALSSTDNHLLYGMNTPAYFAIDNVLAVPEPGTLCLVFLSGFGLLVRRR